MPSDTAIQELLYAILKQKCLKDIDWHKVASDPILTTGITNGHAARMRYSRFKKQIERANSDRINQNSNQNPNSPSPRQPRTTGPKRSRVEKNESPKKIKRGSNAAAATKQEAEENDSEEERERESTVDSNMPLHRNQMMAIKREHAQYHQQNNNQGKDSYMTPVDTPANYCIENEHRSQSPSPGPVPSNQNSFDGMVDDYATSFGMGGSQGNLFGEVQNFEGLGLDLNIGMGFDESIWDGGLDEGGNEEGVLVKTEPSWGEEYRHV